MENNFKELTAVMVSGAVAGFSVDIALFPVDTIKTRLQSKHGFFRAGGFHKLYSGIESVLLGSMPGASLFFFSYEASKNVLKTNLENDAYQFLADMTAASIGETMACLVRVPVEVIKQRAQVNTQSNSLNVFYQCVSEEGYRGLYRGYKSTVLREIPFSIIQFPLWEVFKQKFVKWKKSQISMWESGCCGFVAGGIAAAVTTPLDVAKTRIMLAKKQDSAAIGNILPTIFNIFKAEGLGALFSGIYPRVLLISVGGFVFLGMYDFMNNFVKKHITS